MLAIEMPSISQELFKAWKTEPLLVSMQRSEQIGAKR